MGCPRCAILLGYRIVIAGRFSAGRLVITFVATAVANASLSQFTPSAESEAVLPTNPFDVAEVWSDGADASAPLHVSQVVAWDAASANNPSGCVDTTQGAAEAVFAAYSQTSRAPYNVSQVAIPARCPLPAPALCAAVAASHARPLQVA